MTLIASVLHLDRSDIKALRVTDLYSLHRVVYSLYPDVRDDVGKASGQRSGILFADQGADFHGRRILLLADRSPADAVDGQYGRVDSKPIPDGFLSHASYRFKVVINPTRRDSSTAKLIPVKGRDNVAAWFAERAQSSWGFRVSDSHLQVDDINILHFKDKNMRNITLSQAHIQGHLNVEDAAQFRQSFTQGIGRGRAFGCGLLQIVPFKIN